jgi:hypothetical protein
MFRSSPRTILRPLVPEPNNFFKVLFTYGIPHVVPQHVEGTISAGVESVPSVGPNIQMCVCMYVYMYIYILRSQAYIYIYVCVCVCACFVCVCVCVACLHMHLCQHY